MRDGVVQTDSVARAIFNSGEVSDVSWGKFEPAIRRWEAVMGRPAPAPTQIDENGVQRLSAKFCEWLMGLPDSWITGDDISRKDSLKMAGNGVVWQQAAYALRLILGSETAERERERATSNSNSLSPHNERRTARNILDPASEVLNWSNWYEPRSSPTNERLVMLPTPTVSDTFTGNLKSSQQKEGSLHSVTLPQAVERLVNGNG